jgi:hypothetical protein
MQTINVPALKQAFEEESDSALLLAIVSPT